MTTIAVLPAAGEPGYRAVVNGTEAAGRTVGEAVDALVGAAGGPKGTTLILVQPDAADEFFTAEQRHRLKDLMARWRATRDAGSSLTAEEQGELDALVAAELQAATARSAAALRALKP